MSFAIELNKRQSTRTLEQALRRQSEIMLDPRIAREGVPLVEYERRWRRDVGRELAHAVTTRRIFDVVTRSPSATELAMAIAGPGGMRELMMCRPWHRAGMHA